MADWAARLVALVASGRERTKLARGGTAGMGGKAAGAAEAAAAYNGFWVGGARVGLAFPLPFALAPAEGFLWEPSCLVAGAGWGVWAEGWAPGTTRGGGAVGGGTEGKGAEGT